MAKARYITRTIVTTEVKAYYFDNSSDRVESYYTTLSGEHSAETALAYLRYLSKHSEDSEFKNTNFVKASIITVNEEKYRMTEDDFIRYGERLASSSQACE